MKSFLSSNFRFSVVFTAVAEVDDAVKNAMEALGVGEGGYWTNELTVPSEPEARRWQEEVIKAKLEKPDKIITKVETALVKLLNSKYHYPDEDKKAENAQIARGLILALEALHLRSDTK